MDTVLWLFPAAQVCRSSWSILGTGWARAEPNGSTVSASAFDHASIVAHMADRDRFVGREAELDLLRARLEVTRRGCPQLVTIEGVAGSGKTTLLRRFADESNGVVLLR